MLLLTSRVTSGTEAMPDNNEEILKSLEDVLDRRAPIDGLGALTSAISHKASLDKALKTTAIGLDANVFLRLAKHSRIEDIVDYLNATHAAPLIMPGQAIQEFWNNQLSAVDTVSASLKKKFEALKAETAKIDENFVEFSDRFEAVLTDFNSEYGYIYDESTVRFTLSLLNVLEKRAEVCYVPRLRFQAIAENRKLTKTPPGFKDDGHGDFYIWAEFIFGLLRAKKDGRTFDHAVLVTNDQKIDWSRGGVAHPILTAEVMRATGASFEVWSLERLWKAINA
ncbi:hypothetical protein OKW38_002211 [Paraburkholderia sp. MM5496-R1]|uniref:PIN-like domain-containing protein n=1 Tax=Paraburkholderia sp. MM5496-R1 TaxID=2991065 RepID=UPI003D20297D